MKPTIKIPIPLVIVLALLLCCAACSKAPPTTSGATLTTPATEQNCEQFSELTKMALSEDMFDMTPDEFIAKYKHLITVTSDQNNTPAGAIASREIKFRAAKGNWLLEADAYYSSYFSVDPNKIMLTRGFFSISQHCAPDSKELDARLSQLSPARKNFVETSQDESYWIWDYVDPTNESVIKSTLFTIEGVTTRLTIERNSNHIGEGEGEGESQFEDGNDEG